MKNDNDVNELSLLGNSTNEFKTLVYEKLNGIEIIGKYINKQNKVHCKCLHCDIEFLRYPSLLLRPTQFEFNGCRLCVSRYFGKKKIKFTT